MMGQKSFFSIRKPSLKCHFRSEPQNRKLFFTIKPTIFRYEIFPRVIIMWFRVDCATFRYRWNRKYRSKPEVFVNFHLWLHIRETYAIYMSYHSKFHFCFSGVKIFENRPRNFERMILLPVDYRVYDIASDVYFKTSGLHKNKRRISGSSKLHSANLFPNFVNFPIIIGVGPPVFPAIDNFICWYSFVGSEINSPPPIPKNDLIS